MSALVIHDQPLPYVHALAERPASSIDLVVIHCTELPDLVTARRYGEKILYGDGTGNSGHFYIDRDGAVYRYVPVTRIANQVRGYNTHSIGIELVNLGRYPDWLDSRHQAMTQPYTAAQIAALRALLSQLRQAYPSIHLIAGHEDLDTARVPASDDPDVLVPRKRDPGPLFPWREVLAGSGLQRFVPSSAQAAGTPAPPAAPL